MRPVLALAAALVAAVAVAPQAQSARRVVAIGDVHGSLDGLLAVLRAAGLVSADGRWSGGTATLVQTGDVTDRGAGVRGAFDLIRRLAKEADAAGGRVVPVLGNHEAMNLLGELRDVTPEICATFARSDSDKIRDDAWRDYEKLVQRRARDREGEQPPGLSRTKEGFLGAYPRGCLEYRLALGPDGDYGKWLRTLPIAARVERSVFMHAGAPPDTVESIDVLNKQARDEIARADRVLRRLSDAGLAERWFRIEDTVNVIAAEIRWVNGLVARAKETGEAPDLRGIDPMLLQEAAALLGIGEWSLLKPEGPLWYRGYALAEEPTLDAPFTALLERWDADRLVVGHTVNRDFRIRARLAGRLFLIDTGMLAPVYKGSPSALELVNGVAKAIYADGRVDELVPARP